MITFKQLDAIYWVAELGSFEAAAQKLHTTQSAISKRIHELEDATGVPIFDRSRRSARLTEKGQELLDLSRDVLAQRDYLLERISDASIIQRHLRIGVTELTGLTWLPRLMGDIRERFPRLKIEPSIELSKELFAKLQNDQLDMIIVPDVFADTRFISVPLKSVENVWMAAPGTLSTTQPVKLESIGQHTVLTQGTDSGTGLIYSRWLAQKGVRVSNTIVTNYLLAQVGLTMAGLGVSYLPRHCLNFLVERGALEPLSTVPKLPRVGYSAMYRYDRRGGVNQEVVEIALKACNFDTLYLNHF